MLATSSPTGAVNFTFDTNRYDTHARIVIDDKEAKIYISDKKNEPLKFVGAIPSSQLKAEITTEDVYDYTNVTRYTVNVGTNEENHRKGIAHALISYDIEPCITVIYYKNGNSKNSSSFGFEDPSFLKELKRLINHINQGGFKTSTIKTPQKPKDTRNPSTPQSQDKRPSTPAKAMYTFKDLQIQKGLVVNGKPSIQVDASCEIKNCAGKKLRFELFFYDMNGRPIITDGDAVDPQGVKYFRSRIIDGSATSQQISYWWKVSKSRLAIPAGAGKIKAEVRLVDEGRDYVVCNSFERIINLNSTTPDIYHINNRYQVP